MNVKCFREIKWEKMKLKYIYDDESMLRCQFGFYFLQPIWLPFMTPKNDQEILNICCYTYKFTFVLRHAYEYTYI